MPAAPRSALLVLAVGAPGVDPRVEHAPAVVGAGVQREGEGGDGEEEREATAEEEPPPRAQRRSPLT
jgi:hypothetical protein